MQISNDAFEIKSDINLNNSVTDSTDYFYLSETTTGQNVDKETLQWMSAEMIRMIHIIVRPILIIIGTTGNGLTFYIMRRTSLKDVSSCFYMAVLALADTRKQKFHIWPNLSINTTNNHFTQ